MIKLYDYFRSSACFRVRIALNLKGLDYECIPVHLTDHGGEQFLASYQAINPHQLVPTLQDGDYILTQSLAIIEYLDEKYPGVSLLPTDTFQKSLTKSYALSICADIHPLNNLRVLDYLKNKLTLDEKKKNQWYQHWIQQGLSALEKQLSSSPFVEEFCVGHFPTLADIFLVPQLYNARRFSCPLNEYPTLIKIDANCQKLSAFKEAFPVEVHTSLI
jgi:maleylacetoacetate isomerase